MGLCQPYSDLNVNAYGSKPIASFGLSSENPGNLYQPKGESSSRAGEALHRVVFRAKRHPESSPAEGGIQSFLDPPFAGMTEPAIFARDSLSPPFANVRPLDQNRLPTRDAAFQNQ